MIRLLVYGTIIVAAIAIVASSFYAVSSDAVANAVTLFNGLANPSIDGQEAPILAFMALSGIPQAVAIILEAILFRVLITIAFFVVARLP